MTTAHDPAPERMPPLRPGAIASRLAEIVEIGNRFPGSEGEASCREYLLETFAGLGGDVRTEEFRYLAYAPRSASCRLRSENWELPCAPLQSTANTEAEGPAIYLGSGTIEDIEAAEARGVDLHGKVVVVHSYLPFFTGPLLADRDIAALVNVGETPGGIIAHFTACLYPSPLEPPWDSRILPFPGVTIEAQAARRLLMLMSAGRVTLEVGHQATYEERTSANVIAEIPGATRPEERVVIAGHYDTQLEGPGAWDNASGVAVLLELFEAWRDIQPPRSVVFLSPGVEELGLWGSHHHVARRAADNQQTVGMIDLDGLGSPFAGTRCLFADGAMASFAAESARRVGWEVESEIDASQFPFADYSPFLDAGVPACWLFTHPPQHPYYHSSRDVLDHVDVGRLIDIATPSAYIAFRLAHVVDHDLGRARVARIWADLPATTAIVEARGERR